MYSKMPNKTKYKHLFWLWMAKYSHTTNLNDDFVENQFQIALIIYRSIDKKVQSRLLSKAIKEGFYFATLKWHRLTCYLSWAVLIGDPVR